MVKVKNFEKNIVLATNMTKFLIITEFYFFQNKRYQGHHYFGKNDPKKLKFSLLGVVRDVN